MLGLMRRYKNISRFEYSSSTFEGWRFSVCRAGRRHTRYFSDRMYGSSKAALEAALRYRTFVFLRCRRYPDEPSLALDEDLIRAAYRDVPKGLHRRVFRG